MDAYVYGTLSDCQTGCDDLYDVIKLCMESHGYKCDGSNAIVPKCCEKNKNTVKRMTKWSDPILLTDGTYACRSIASKWPTMENQADAVMGRTTVDVSALLPTGDQ